MRINLKTPFAEKDAVKALGARWDATRKIWYIVDVPDLTPFMRWIPDVLAASEDSAAQGSASPSEAPLKAAARQSGGVITRSTVVVPRCGCNTLPWLDCPHTAN